MSKILETTQVAIKSSVSELIDEFNTVESRLDNIETSHVSIKEFQELEQEVHNMNDDLHTVVTEFKTYTLAHAAQHTREQDLLNADLHSLKYKQHIMLTALKWLSVSLIAAGIGLLALSIHALS